MLEMIKNIIKIWKIGKCSQGDVQHQKEPLEVTFKQRKFYYLTFWNIAKRVATKLAKNWNFVIKQKKKLKISATKAAGDHQRQAALA